METNQVIKSFASFLNASWNIAVPLLSARAYTTNENAIGDWLQANWEILVEKRVLQQNEYLEVYSDGADYNGSSSRINDLNALPTHSLNALLERESMDVLNNEIINSKAEFEFDRLIGFQNGFYIDAPPFEFALIRDGSIERVFKLEHITFKVTKLQSGSF